MAVPKKKTSKSRRNMRRAHDSMNVVGSTSCSNCGLHKLPHNVCTHCGMYRGRQVLNVKSKEVADETQK